MRAIEAPEVWTAGAPSVFLGGGISGCPDWQARMIQLLASTELILLNPRRANYPWSDPAAAEEQILWEHRHLRQATAILFWFPCETLCPITLYELGAWSMTEKPLFIGTHPRYARRLDILIQTRLVRPDVQVRDTLEDLAEDLRRWTATPSRPITEMKTP